MPKIKEVFPAHYDTKESQANPIPVTPLRNIGSEATFGFLCARPHRSSLEIMLGQKMFNGFSLRHMFLNVRKFLVIL
jgi:hypothetical protein